MMPRQHKSPDRRRLAAALKQLRENTGLSAARFGEPHGWSQGKVSKIENGRTVPSPEDVEIWVVATDADADHVASLVALADSVATETRRWAGSRHGSLAARSEEAGMAEADAGVVRVFQPAVIPGLLQTADYARHVITLLGASDERDIAAAVNARMQRQDGLYDGEKRFEFVLTEGALRWRPGTPSMMLAQLDRVITVATLPNVDIRVLPFSTQAPALYVNGFTVYEIADDPYVLVEILTTELHLREESDLAAYRATLERCKDAALAGEAAVEAVRALRSELLAT
jgi:transcriptional regulator with XRE-family HTH domain